MATAASQTYIAKLGFSDPDRSKDRHGLACEYLFERLLDLEMVPVIFAKERAWYEKRLERISIEHEALMTEHDKDPSRKTFYFSDLWTCRSGDEDLGWLDSNLSVDQLIQRLNDLSSLYAKLKSDLDSFSRARALDNAKNAFHVSRCLNAPIMTGYASSYTAGFADVLLRSFEFHGQSLGRYCTPSILGEVKITKQSAETVLQQINYYREHIKGGVEKVYILTDYDCSDLQRLTQGSSISVYRLGKRFDDWISARSIPHTPEL